MRLTHTMSRKQTFLTILRNEPTRVMISISCVILASIVELIPWLAIYLSAQAIVNQQPIIMHSMVILVAIIVRYTLYSTAVWQAHLVAYHVIAKIRQHIISALAYMPVEKLKDFRQADLEKRISDDCQQLEPLIAHHGTDIINGLLMPIFLTCLLFYIDWRIGLIAFIPLPIAAAIQFLMMRGFSDRLEKYNDVVSRMHSAQLEFIRSLGVMKLFAVDASSYQQLYRSMRRHNRIVIGYTQQMITAWVSFITIAQTSFILIIPFAITFTLNGSISTSDLVMVSVITAGLLKPWLDLTQIAGQMQHSLLSLDRLIPLFGQGIIEKKHQTETIQLLSCNNLTVSRGDRQILKNINKTIFPGEKVVIHGSSGSGKSSLIEVLTGSLNADEGGWYINNNPVNQLNDKQRAHLITLVGQRAVFFKGSIKDNLLLAANDVSDSAIWQVLTSLHLAPVIYRLSNGIDTKMGVTERHFSGGEMQRLSIARAILANTPILILDEATAHLDVKTEFDVLKTIDEYSPCQTKIIITHKTNAVHNFNRRWFIHNTSVIEE